MQYRILTSGCLLTLLWAGSTLNAASFLFTPATQLLENDTYAAVLRLSEEGDREGLLNLINRNYWFARKALIRLLRQSDKFEQAKSFAELFPSSCESELEVPLIDIYARLIPAARERLLNWMETITDAELWIGHGQAWDDRFHRESTQAALDAFRDAAEQFDSLGFWVGKAFCLYRWNIWRLSPATVTDLDARIEGLEAAQALFHKSGCSRGEAHCLSAKAMLFERGILDKQKALELSNQAQEKASLDVKEEPGLRNTTYLSLLEEPLVLESFRAMLADETDPIQRIIAEWHLITALKLNGRNAEALTESQIAIDLARQLPYDMSAYDSAYVRIFAPAVPWMLAERASMRSAREFKEREADYLEALKLLEETRRVAPHPSVDALAIDVLKDLSSLYRTLQEYGEAEKTAQQALTLARKTDARSATLAVCEVLAEIYTDLGDLHSAETYLQEASQVTYWKPYFNPAFLNLAQLHLNFQLYEDALRDLERAREGLDRYLQVRPWMQERDFQIKKMQRLQALAWLQLGEYDKAMEIAKKTEGMAEGLVGTVLVAMKRYSEAERYFKDRLNATEVREGQRPLKEVDALIHLGSICRLRGQLQEASEYLTRALELYRLLGDRRGELDALEHLGQLSLRFKDFGTSGNFYQQALNLAGEVQDQQGIWSSRFGLAQVDKAAGHRQEAVSHLKAAVEAVEAVSGRMGVDLYRSGFLEGKTEIFDDLIRLLGPSQPAEAFHYAERRQARAFLESAQKLRIPQSPAGSPGLFRKKQEVQARLVASQKTLQEQFTKPTEKRDSQLIASLRKDLAQIRQEHSALLEEMELSYPVEAARQGIVTPLTVSQVQYEVLKPNQSLVEYVVMDREVDVFLVNQQVCRYFRLPINRKDLVALVEQLHRPFRELQQGRVDLLHLNYDVGLSHRLFRLIFQPVESQLPSGGQVIIVPDDVLNYLPFESLARSATLGSPEAGLPYAEYKEVDWLVRHFTFSYAISATSLDPRLRLAEPPPHHLLAFGNPMVNTSQHKDIARVVLRRFSESDAELPYLYPLPQAASESRRVAQLMAGKLTARALTGPQATKREFFQEAPKAGYLHFAVHSLINEDQPDYSALVLAPDQISDGLLQAFEIYNTPLNSRLVTLSGCETALGKLRRGEGLLSLQRAFLLAGAQSVVVSLWSIEDSTSHFMEVFYRNLSRGHTVAVSLRNAKLSYLKETLTVSGQQQLSLSHPFFWAPFVLTATNLE